MKKALLTGTALISAALVASPSMAAIDVSAGLAEMDSGQAALESIGLKAIAVAIAAFALFFVFRRIPK